MSQKPPPLGLISSSITSPSKTPAGSNATDTPSGLGQYGMVARPRFMTNQITSPTTINASPKKQSRNSFRYRPSRPSLGYVFDNNHNNAPEINNNPSGSGKKSKKNKAKSRQITRNTNKNGKMSREEMEKIRDIRQARKQSTLASFSQTPNGQTFDAIKKELEFLKREVPNFESKYQTALAAFHSTSHSKSRQVEYAFIQALSSWIMEDGAPAVKELTEFKQDVQFEMQGLVSQLEDMSKENQSLKIVISDLQQQNDDISKAYTDTNKELSKLNTVLKDTEVEQETEQLKEDDFVDLSKDLERSQEQNRILKEKINRLESYLKQTQKDNDDLNNKTFAMENDLQQSKTENLKLTTKITSLEQQHEQELMILAKAHDDYRTQMETEQAQLVQIAEESQKQVQELAKTMTKPRSGTITTPMFDDEYNSNAPLHEEAGGTTLDAEFNQYPFSEDEWLDDSEEAPISPPEEAPKQAILEEVILDTNTMTIEPIHEPTPPPFDSEFKFIKESMGESPIDPTKTFKLEKEKTGVELEDITKYFLNERKSYSEDTKDITKDFTMSSLTTGVDTKDITQEFSMQSSKTGIDIKDPTQEFSMQSSKTGVDNKDPTSEFSMETSKIGVDNKDPTMEFTMESSKIGVDIKDQTESWSMEKQGTDNEIKEKDISNGFETIKQSNNVETIDITQYWRSERSEVIEVNPIDPEASFVSEKQEFGVEPDDPTKHFQTHSQKLDLERADLSNTFKMETKLYESEEKPPEEFVMEKRKASVHQVESPQFESAKADNSYTPTVEPEPEAPLVEFESGRMSIIKDKEPPRPQYAYQIRHLRMDVDAAPARVTKIRKPPPAAHDRPDFSKHYDGKDEIIRKSLAFQKIMSKWKKDETEKGGKPEILKKREYELVTKWNNDEKARMNIKKRVPVNRNNDSPNSPSYEIFSSITQGNTAQKITKTRMHKLKPKLNGTMTIIRSHFVPKYQLKKEIQFYFCLDGLPSLTNLDKNESEKDRKNDFLVPVLFFFDNENDYKLLQKEAGALPVRNAIFQKAFSRIARGIITLHTHSCDRTLDDAIHTLEVVKGRKINFSKKNENVKPDNGKSLYIVNENDFHRFEFDNEEMRDEWLHKITRLVMKRTNSVQRATETFQGSHKQSLGIGTPIQRAARASSRMSTVQDVETSFD